MIQNNKILVTGSTGLAGSAIVRALLQRGYSNIYATYRKRKPNSCFSKQILESNAINFIQIDLLDQQAVSALFKRILPEYVFLAAAKVGGIMANHNNRAEFIYENLQLQTNIIHSSYLFHIKKLLFLGSTCIYPMNAPQPMKEDCLMSDKLEYLSEPYGVAKIAGIKMCESYNLQYDTNFIAVMPTNLYGPNDNYDLQNSHFLPAFIRKMHLGKSLMINDWDAIRDDLNTNMIEGIDGQASNQVIIKLLEKYGINKDPITGIVNITLWGTGKPRREILHSDELADACMYIMQNIDFSDLQAQSKFRYSEGVITNEVRNTQLNIGLGFDYSLYDIAIKVKHVVGFEGNITWDHKMPDGTFQKLTDITKLSELGWKSRLDIAVGVKDVYDYYLRNSRSNAAITTY